MSLAHEELTHDIIGAAIEVHRQLGPGFVERIYHNALCIELNHRRIAFDRETRIAVRTVACLLDFMSSISSLKEESSSSSKLCDASKMFTLQSSALICARWISSTG
jgi:hypothetical protein